jgi:hypothetical protein
MGRVKYEHGPGFVREGDVKLEMSSTEEYRLSTGLTGKDSVWHDRSLSGPSELICVRVLRPEPGCMVESIDVGAGNELVQSVPANLFDGTCPQIDGQLLFSRVGAHRMLHVVLSHKAGGVQLYLRPIVFERS